MKFARYSMLVALGLIPCVGNAAIRIGNANRVNAYGYQQVMANANASTAMSTQTMGTDTTNAVGVAELPIKVSDKNLASKIQSGENDSGVTMDHLERCAMIYPNGEFEWARPRVGLDAGSGATCTAVIEIRAIGAGPNGADAVLARTNLAAGDSVKCNISAFPEASWLPAAGEVEFPADAQPTVEDVIAVMNEEQKQNAAVKLIGGAILGGLGGNITGANAPGSDSIIGGGRDKIINTVVGAVGGTAIAAGGTYGGKVAGDMIMSAGVNAAAGAVVGNVMSNSDTRLLRIENCKVDNVDQQCLWGNLLETNSTDSVDEMYVSSADITDFKICKTNETNETNKQTCSNADLTNVKISSYYGKTNVADNKPFELSDMLQDKWSVLTPDEKYCYNDGEMEKMGVACDDNKPFWVKITSANKVSKRIPVMLVGVSDSAFGHKSSDWAKLQLEYANLKIVSRAGRGEAVGASDHGTLSGKLGNFEPMYIDSGDGGIIDMDNKARLADTLTGAGVGAGAGAFTAYQGAQNEIEERWVAEVHAYKNSLQKVYCATGTRFLSFYNDQVAIPDMYLSE